MPVKDPKSKHYNCRVYRVCIHDTIVNIIQNERKMGLITICMEILPDIKKKLYKMQEKLNWIWCARSFFFIRIKRHRPNSVLTLYFLIYILIYNFVRTKMASTISDYSDIVLCCFPSFVFVLFVCAPHTMEMNASAKVVWRPSSKIGRRLCAVNRQTT